MIPATKPLCAEQQEAVNFLEAISSHIFWRNRLESCLAANDTIKDSFKTTDCNLCKWIDGAGRRHYGRHSEFQDLIALHNRFHDLANHIILCIENNKRPEAETLLTTEYATASRLLIAQLTYLHQLFAP